MVSHPPGAVIGNHKDACVSLQLKINGRDHALDAPVSVSGLLERLGLDARKVAVERNLEIVPRSTHATTMVADGDRIEIVNFVGGG